MNRTPPPPIYLLLGLALIATLYFLLPDLNVLTLPLRITGAGVAGLGLLLALAGALTLRQHRTTIGFDTSSCLVTTGIYRMTRNPMYLSILLTLLGAGLLSGNLPALAVAPAAYIPIRLFLPGEERSLERQFGEEFTTYTSRTPRWL